MPGESVRNHTTRTTRVVRSAAGGLTKLPEMRNSLLAIVNNRPNASNPMLPLLDQLAAVFFSHVVPLSLGKEVLHIARVDNGI